MAGREDPVKAIGFGAKQASRLPGPHHGKPRSIWRLADRTATTKTGEPADLVLVSLSMPDEPDLCAEATLRR